MICNAIRCPACQTEQVKTHTGYTLHSGGLRWIYYCSRCDRYFSSTYNTPLAGLRTPLSRIQMVLDALNDGLSVNATCRTFHVAKNTVYLWQRRVGALKPVLYLYALCHQFLQQLIEGDELYTKVDRNLPPMAAEGWTIVLMERASRFLWALECGPKDEKLFKKAVKLLAAVIAQTQSLALFTDGERRYSLILFDLCRQALRKRQRGRPKQTLPEGVTVRLKNKGSQAHKRGRKRPKYEAPVAEHPATVPGFTETDIHANHVEAFNSALRRRLACYRRKTNTYAKHQPALQRRLDVYWLLHNFVRPHFTTQQVPAVALGILDEGLTWAELFSIPYP